MSNSDFASAGLTVGQLNALVKKVGGEDVVRQILNDSLVFKIIESPLLDFINTITIPATTKSLVAKDKFVINISRKAKAKIGFLGGNFKEWFLSGNGKIEDPIAETTLRYVNLRKPSVDAPIIAELSGKERAETTLSELYALLEKQCHGEDGPLLTNGYANIFYVRDQNGALRAVRAYWSGGRWGVHARSVEDPFRWIDGYRVFSRNS